ncbi:hypothetical protein HAX54_020271, partial [Datura stramonium]|nr:hypothetical protein [Datura stramonium]
TFVQRLKSYHTHNLTLVEKPSKVRKPPGPITLVEVDEACNRTFADIGESPSPLPLEAVWRERKVHRRSRLPNPYPFHRSEVFLIEEASYVQLH